MVKVSDNQPVPTLPVIYRVGWKQTPRSLHLKQVTTINRQSRTPQYPSTPKANHNFLSPGAHWEECVPF